MANIKKIDPKMLKWDTPNVLYRGNTQTRFEGRIITSFVKGKPIYYGFDLREDKEKRTYVDESLSGGEFYASYRLKDLGKEISSLTKYPLIMSIRADKYIDRLRISDEGEGIFIQGEIDADDITILFSSECNKLPERIPRHIIHDVELIGLDKEKSLIKRYHQNKKNTMSDLELLCFGPRVELTTLEERQKIIDAMAYLQRKLEGN